MTNIWRKKLFRITKYGAPLTSMVGTGEVGQILERHTDLKDSAQNVHDRLDQIDVGTIMEIGDGISIQRMPDAEAPGVEDPIAAARSGKHKYEGR